jgi:hypothetical protein
MLFDDELLSWTKTLTGTPSDLVSEAVQQVTSWKMEHLERELCNRPSVDTVVATALLSQAFDELRAAGIPENKLLSKLRHDRAVWPTWTELRAACLLLRSAPDGVQFEYEPNRRGGKQPDFLFTLPNGGPSVAVEFKAIGLSDQEAEFCKRVAPSLDALLPPHGWVNVQAPVSIPQLKIENIDVQALHSQALRASRNIRNFPADLAGVTIVGRHSEPQYRRRLALRLRNEVVRQLQCRGHCLNRRCGRLSSC